MGGNAEGPKRIGILDDNLGSCKLQCLVGTGTLSPAKEPQRALKAEGPSNANFSVQRGTGRQVALYLTFAICDSVSPQIASRTGPCSE